MIDPPENCKLIAHWTGAGWHLAVRHVRGEDIAILAWPKAWPAKMSAAELRLYGFEIVPGGWCGCTIGKRDADCDLHREGK